MTQDTFRGTPSVFLDTNVVASYLGGGLPWLFDAAVADRFTYAINPVVLQELVLARQPDGAGAGGLEAFLAKADMLPLDGQKAGDLIDRAKTLGEAGVHANDILILSSASTCDYLLTSDDRLKHLLKGDRPKVMTPDEFRRGVEILG